ncbi:MAG: hypothetical protein WDM88_04140, partial [Galbitalea sp.]
DCGKSPAARKCARSAERDVSELVPCCDESLLKQILRIIGVVDERERISQNAGGVSGRSYSPANAPGSPRSARAIN